VPPAARMLQCVDTVSSVCSSRLAGIKLTPETKSAMRFNPDRKATGACGSRSADLMLRGNAMVLSGAMDDMTDKAGT
jgi:hypothetical protein